MPEGVGEAFTLLTTAPKAIPTPNDQSKVSVGGAAELAGGKG
jgi:hypothetical protein